MSSPPALAAALALLVLLAAAGPPAAAVLARTGEADGEIWWENRYAILEVRYSLTRPHPPLDPGYPPEWKEGVIRFMLYEHRAPITTANFIELAERGFYDGTIFHRVIDDFVIQGGDPDANDPTRDGSGKPIPLEIHPELTHVDGAVGMAREIHDEDSAESQFYICDGPQHQLDDAERRKRTPPERGYAVFGVVVEGIKVVREIATVWTDTDRNNTEPLPVSGRGLHDRPIYDVTLKRVTITPKVASGSPDGGGDDGILGPGGGGYILLALIAIPVILVVLRAIGRLPRTGRGEPGTEGRP